ncbi:hypothetical protein T265_08562 [Opisthorchis viverrini]|uniref:Uncharacterized protein n=1 Tax=Opisthorchis viverrini TaxID=6198 RepID=A0A074ZD37_OPIVI|nr:hypothetical protein T265_08562 [Opisthorchis viverrini]KER23567.1 hypothetical protein T265_08562 [Opisthorchis viverrini]
MSLNCLQNPDRGSNSQRRGKEINTANGLHSADEECRFEQPDSISALVFPSGRMATRHLKGATAERLLLVLPLRDHTAGQQPVAERLNSNLYPGGRVFETVCSFVRYTLLMVLNEDEW